ncbi:MAG TPA: hypothetical protein DCK79_09790 [Candidatus Atribacteria bacterium]|jgi:signal transduction histidine kinase/prenyltransferase beta subunit|nr:hypothetical protein [Candidatus Atribacteria bacterium]
MTRLRLGSVYILLLVGILLISGVYLWVNTYNHNAQTERALSEYEVALERYKLENIYYTPEDIVHYVRICQNPTGYFVLNPDLIFEPSELNKNTMKTTRYSVVALDKLNSINVIKGNATVDYIMSNYVFDIQFTNNPDIGHVNYADFGYDGYAAFRTLPDSCPGVKTTLDALMVLESLDALNDPRLNLTRVENFILAHQNPDGGFWDEDYSSYGNESTLRCTPIAIRALGRIYQYQGREFDEQFKNNVTRFISSCVDESDGGYANKPGGESTEIYGTFRAFISLWWLGGSNESERRTFVEENMDVNRSVQYLFEKLYNPETGAFFRYEDKAQESIKGTHLAVWFLEDMDRKEELDIYRLGHYIMDNEINPGQYGVDIYSTYAAVWMLTRLEFPTESLSAPEKPATTMLGYPEFLPLIFIVLGLLALGASYFVEKKGREELQREITERKKLEEALRKAKEEAERANQMKSIFLASMSHELRTPLNSIIGFVGIILQGLAGKLNDEQKKQLEMAYGSAKHLLSLINDLLDISKIETGELKPDIEEFNIAKAGIEIRDSLMLKAEEKGLEFICDIPDINIFSDKRRFEQVLLNLVNNAIKFTEEGKVEVKAVEKDEKIEVIVKDTGIGIKKEDFHKLFQPFVQLEYIITEEGGTGLGLYLAKNLAQLLYGEIKVESEYGKGSTFTFILPLKYGG